MSESSKTPRTSYEQVKAIVDYMGQHSDLASCSNRTTEGRHANKQRWAELAKVLNSYRGARKTPVGWSKYYSDLKCKLKTKIQILNKMKRNGQTSETTDTPNITKLERRLLVILGPDFAKTKSKSKESKSDIKSEFNHDESSCRSGSEASGRLSVSGLNDDFEEKDEEMFEHERSSITNDSMFEGISPKWLIDVEKKRAKADLIRARNEQHQVSVAAKNADAAVMQAEALKKFAEAACVQADAIMRIASILEHRGQTDMLQI